MLGAILRNVLLLGSLALLAFGIVWGFFRLFVPTTSAKAPKWRTPAAAAGFIALYTALIGIYVPLVNREPAAVLVQETEYGSVELDVNKLFEYGDSNQRVGIPDGYYAASDTSFYLDSPDRSFWLTEADSLPSFRLALELQQNHVGMKVNKFLSTLLGTISYESSKVERYCAVEAGNRQLIYTNDTRMGGRPVNLDFISDNFSYWRALADRFPLALQELMPDSLRDEVDIIRVPDAEVLDFMSSAKAMWATKDPLPRQYLFRNTLCILAFHHQDLQPELARSLDLPQRPLHLMRFGEALEYAVPSFDLAALKDLVTSNDGRVLLARDPIHLDKVVLDGTTHEQLSVEQLYLLAVSRDRGYFVQVQFMMAPGQDLSTWRQIQSALRSLRFVAYR